MIEWGRIKHVFKMIFGKIGCSFQMFKLCSWSKCSWQDDNLVEIISFVGLHYFFAGWLCTIEYWSENEEVFLLRFTRWRPVYTGFVCNDMSYFNVRKQNRSRYFQILSISKTSLAFYKCQKIFFFSRSVELNGSWNWIYNYRDALIFVCISVPQLQLL